VWSYRDAVQRGGFVHRNSVRSKTIVSLENYVASAPIRFLSKRGNRDSETTVALGY
jgi:hypothetical protein